MVAGFWGVYRVNKDGSTSYVSRSATSNERLARDIAADLSAGCVVMPDGSERTIKARPHVAKIIGSE